MDSDGVNSEVTGERKPQVSHLMTVSIVLGVAAEFVLLGTVNGNPPDWLVFGLFLAAPLTAIAAIAQIWSSRGRVKGPMSVWASLGVWLLLAAMVASFFLLSRVHYVHPV